MNFTQSPDSRKLKKKKSDSNYDDAFSSSKEDNEDCLDKKKDTFEIKKVYKSNTNTCLSTINQKKKENVNFNKCLPNIETIGKDSVSNNNNINMNNINNGNIINIIAFKSNNNLTFPSNQMIANIFDNKSNLMKVMPKEFNNISYNSTNQINEAIKSNFVVFPCNLGNTQDINNNNNNITHCNYASKLDEIKGKIQNINSNSTILQILYDNKGKFSINNDQDKENFNENLIYQNMLMEEYRDDESKNPFNIINFESSNNNLSILNNNVNINSYSNGDFEKSSMNGDNLNDNINLKFE